MALSPLSFTQLRWADWESWGATAQCLGQDRPFPQPRAVRKLTQRASVGSESGVYLFICLFVFAQARVGPLTFLSSALGNRRLAGWGTAASQRARVAASAFLLMCVSGRLQTPASTALRAGGRPVRK